MSWSCVATFAIMSPACLFPMTPLNIESFSPFGTSTRFPDFNCHTGCVGKGGLGDEGRLAHKAMVNLELPHQYRSSGLKTRIRLFAYG
jgi:hypothetical protein